MSLKKCSLTLKTKLKSDVITVRSTCLKRERWVFNLPGKGVGLEDKIAKVRLEVRCSF